MNNGASHQQTGIESDFESLRHDNERTTSIINENTTPTVRANMSGRVTAAATESDMSHSQIAHEPVAIINRDFLLTRFPVKIWLSLESLYILF